MPNSIRYLESIAAKWRRCVACLKIRDIEDFWKSGTKGSGHLWSCKHCQAPHQKSTRKKDTNFDKARTRAKKWREAHPDLFNARIRQWRQNYPERHHEMVRRRRANKRSNGAFLITKRELERLLNRQQHSCYICAARLDHTKELDHIIPIARGGQHSIGNVAWACHYCNRHKTTKLLIEVKHARGFAGTYCT